MAVSAFPDKRLLWHPRQDNKFVVGGGSDIALYQWTPDHPEIHHVTSRRDLQFMKVRFLTYPRIISELPGFITVLCVVS